MPQTSYPQALLIVDDDAAMVPLIGHWLAQAWPGYTPIVRHATSLSEALDVLLDRTLQPPTDAIVVDCRLGDSVGLHAPVKLIEAMDYDRAPIPTVILTGTVAEEDHYPALRLGVQAFLCKNRDDLAVRLPEVLREGWARHRFWEERFDVLRKPRRP